MVILDGIEYTFKLATDGESVLDTAHRVYFTSQHYMSYLMGTLYCHWNEAEVAKFETLDEYKDIKDVMGKYIFKQDIYWQNAIDVCLLMDFGTKRSVPELLNIAVETCPLRIS